MMLRTLRSSELCMPRYEVDQDEPRERVERMGVFRPALRSSLLILGKPYSMKTHGCSGQET